MTNDYGEHWTLLTDGTNGIPIDQPMHVVREDPRAGRAALRRHASGAFVSFNRASTGSRCSRTCRRRRSPTSRSTTAISSISTMGRSFWIMDNVAPLRQMAAIAQRTHGPTQPGQRVRQRRLRWHTRRERSIARAGARRRCPQHACCSSRARPIRYRTLSAGGRQRSRIPGAGAHIDFWFQAAPPADAKLEIVDAKGQVIELGRDQAGAPPAAGRRCAGLPARRRQLAPASCPKPACSASRGTCAIPGRGRRTRPKGGAGGPMAPPREVHGAAQSRAGRPRPHVRGEVDPRVPRDGVTQADLDEQVAFQLRVRDAISDARRLQQRDRRSDEEGGRQPGLPPATPGTTPATSKFAHPLQKLWAHVVDMPGIYPQPMLISQLQNVQRMVGQADQKVGQGRGRPLQRSCRRNWRSLQAEFAKVAK